MLTRNYNSIPAVCQAERSKDRWLIMATDGVLVAHVATPLARPRDTKYQISGKALSSGGRAGYLEGPSIDSPRPKYRCQLVRVFGERYDPFAMAT